MEFEFEKIPIILKRFSFKEKMALCQNLSKQIMKIDKLEFVNKSSVARPWEIEILCELSLLSKNEYREGSFLDTKGIRTKISLINCLRNYTHPEFEKDLFIGIMVMAQQQFLPQRNLIFRLYRYNYLFTYNDSVIDMNVIFRKMFQDDYSEILEAIWVFYCLIIYDQSPFPILNYAFNQYMHALKNFIQSREENIEMQSEYSTNGVDSYYYGFKAIYPFPIIKCENVLYLPVPYLLIDAGTESLLCRLTRNNDDLRCKIGKNVIEKYLYHLLSTAKCYEEVVYEDDYNINRKQQNLKSPDVMVLSSDHSVFFDCKASVPSLSLRDFDKEKINNTRARYADNMIKLFKRIQDFHNGYFYPFINKRQLLLKNIFGVIVVWEDSYIHRESIYNEIAVKLNMSVNSDDIQYIKSNIKIIGFEEIESASFYSEDYGRDLLAQRDIPGKWYDYTFIDRKRELPIIKEVESFKELLIEKFQRFADTYNAQV